VRYVGFVEKLRRGEADGDDRKELDNVEAG
jgi:hypothetical protein